MRDHLLQGVSLIYLCLINPFALIGPDIMGLSHKGVIPSRGGDHIEGVIAQGGGVIIIIKQRSN